MGRVPRRNAGVAPPARPGHAGLSVSDGLFLVGLLGLGVVVAIAARKLEIPYTVALVGAGLLVGALHPPTVPWLSREALYLIFLPGLIYAASQHLDVPTLRQNKRAVLLLAVPGLVAAAAMTSVAIALVRRSPGRGARGGSRGSSSGRSFRQPIRPPSSRCSGPSDSRSASSRLSRERVCSTMRSRLSSSRLRSSSRPGLRSRPGGRRWSSSAWRPSVRS